MDLKSAIFYLLSAILVLAALRVITARNPVHAALFLVLAFFNAAGIWLLLEAEFLAMILVVVYVGAVMVLFIFVVMMLDINLERLRRGFWSYLPLGAAIGALLTVEMALVVGGPYFGLEEMPTPAPAGADVSNTKDLARLMFSSYVYPFELASVVLLMAIVAAVVITKRARKSTKAQDPSAQVAVRAKDRFRLVAMPAEKE